MINGDRKSSRRSSELFAAAQQRFNQNGHRTNGRRNGQAAYLFTGMVLCASGHQPLAMYGRQRKGNTYLTCDYGRTYGKVAAEQIDGHGQWLSLREDALLPLVEQFFAERIFGPMRLDKLARQLRAHQKAPASRPTPGSASCATRSPTSTGASGCRSPRLNRGIEPDLVGQRIAELREAKDAAEIELRGLTPAAADSGPDEDPAALLARIPSLAHALRQAPPEIKRQVFDAFGLKVTYDKTARHIEIRATITEAIGQALHNAEDLPEEVSNVAHKDIAGARFVPRSDSRIVQRYRAAA
jgi:site-specific DNA recombinase